MEDYCDGEHVYIRKLREEDYSVYREVNYLCSLFSLKTQKDMKRLVGARSVCLDAYGTDLAGKNMIWKSRSKIRERTHTEPDTIQV